MHAGFWPAITRRAAASSVAPIALAMGAPCVLASLGARDPETRQHHLKGHSSHELPAQVELAFACFGVFAQAVVLSPPRCQEMDDAVASREPRRAAR